MSNEKIIKEVKNFNINKNIKEVDTIKNCIKQADKIASKDYGAKGAKDFIETTNNEMSSSDKYTRSTAKTRAASYVADLAKLILYQTIEDNNKITYMKEFSEVFNDGNLHEGNTKQYIATLDTGNETYDANAFIPKGITKPMIESKLISMLNSDGTLTSTAYQFKKPLTITEAQWMPYFKAGNLKGFIEKISGDMVRAYDLFKFDKIARLLTSLKPQKEIVGTEKDCFRALSNEVFPEIENMLKYNSEYNLDGTSDYTDAGNESNIMIVVGNKLLSRIKNGVSSQLFNAQFFGTNSSPYDIVSLNNQLTIGDANTPTKTSSTQYVDEDTIWVIDKGLIKSLLQVESNESQAWATNMTIQLTLHVWGVIDTLPWKKVFKYTNPNLKVLP